MADAVSVNTQGDCITPELLKLLDKRVARFLKLGYGQVSIIIEKHKIRWIRTVQDENIADLLVKPIAE